MTQSVSTPPALLDWFRSRRESGDRTPTLIIGEIAQAHDGSLGAAHAYIDALAEAGADAVKFQTHIASAESTPDEPWRVRFSPQDERRIDYWQRMEFTEAQWLGLKQHADERGLLFLSSPFSLAAVELLIRIGASGWKIASGELTHVPMLRRIAATGLPVLLSTGMSSWKEIDQAIDWLRPEAQKACARAENLAIFQCTSSYPTPPESVGLNLLDELRQRYGCPVGLSDHSGTPYPTLAGVARGMDLVELHVTFSRHAFGPDVPASLTVEQFAETVQGVRAIEKMLHHPIDKDIQANAMAPMRQLFQRGLVAARPLSAGHVLAEHDLLAKKPAHGLPPDQLDSLVGRTLARSLEADQRISWEDLE